MTFNDRIDSGLFRDEKLTEKYDLSYTAVTRLFNNWTILSGFPCGAV